MPSRSLLSTLLVLSVFTTPGNLFAQRVRAATPPTTIVQFQNPAPTTQIVPGSGARTPTTQFVPPGSSGSYAQPGVAPIQPGATLGVPQFDPYAQPSGGSGFGTPAGVAPSLTSPSVSPYGATSTPGFTPPPSPFSQPYVTAPIPQSQYGQPYDVYPGQAYPGQAYPAPQPPALFPGGGLAAGNSWAWAQPAPGPYLRLFQDVGFTYTWLSDFADGLNVDQMDLEISATLNYPNFLWSKQPLHVTPGFIFHWLDGPVTPPAAAQPPAYSLPSQLYSTYLDFNWHPTLGPRLGLDLNATVGVYSDFDTVTRRSIRVQTLSFISYNVTPRFAIKGGINYLDRNEVKFLPAGGFVWRPSEYTYYEVLFPKPKIASYLATWGNTNVWWHLGGEYGGGAWTIDRAASERIDMNDIRVYGGLEWYGPRGFYGLLEVGYVFDREVVYVDAPADSFKPRDTIMVRGSIRY